MPTLSFSALRRPMLATALTLGLGLAQAQTGAPTPAPASPPPLATTPVAAPVTVTGPADTGAGRVGTFKQVQGETWIGTGPDRRTPAPGDSVRQADRVSTGRTGAASLVLRDGTVLTVGPDSLVDIRRFQYDSTTQQGNFLLDLLQGSVRLVTGLLAKVNPDLFKVHTPTSVVGVRGTDFIVETQPAAQ